MSFVIVLYLFICIKILYNYLMNLMNLKYKNTNKYFKIKCEECYCGCILDRLFIEHCGECDGYGNIYKKL